MFVFGDVGCGVSDEVLGVSGESGGEEGQTGGWLEDVHDSAR